MADDENSLLIMVDLGLARLGGSVLAQVYNQMGDDDDCPDLDDPDLLKAFFSAIQTLNSQGKVIGVS